MASGDTILNLGSVPIESEQSRRHDNHDYNIQTTVLDNSVITITVVTQTLSSGGRPTTPVFTPGKTFDITIKEH